MFAQKSQSSQTASQTIKPIEPIDPNDQPPLDRYCDVVLQGGVVDGVVYPGFLVELARKFRFRSVGGTSVGAIAACLAVACEYRRRFNNSPEGFNEGLAKLPEKLSEFVNTEGQVTRIRSLFQPEPELRPLFNFLVDWLEDTNDEPLSKMETKLENSGLTGQKPIQKQTFFSASLLWRTAVLAWKHFGLNGWEHLCTAITALTMCLGLWSLYQLLGGQNPLNFVDYFQQVQLGILVLPVTFCMSYFILGYLALPICKIYRQIKRVTTAPGYGMCSGLSVGGDKPALIDWLYKGVQDASGMPYNRPLTFSDLWKAPCGPELAFIGQQIKSLDLAVISSCLSHGRMYEIPSKDPTARVFFRLSEFAKYFPKEIIDYLRLKTLPVDVSKNAALRDKFKRRLRSQNKEAKPRAVTKCWVKLRSQLTCSESDDSRPDIRELPNGDLPIVVAARMSFAVPVLFQALPLLGLDLEQNPEDMRLVRLWFADGGMTSNMPAQLFDKALPRWPTFAARILNVSPKRSSLKGEPFVPYSHDLNADDALIDPRDQSGYTCADGSQPQNWQTFGRFVIGVYETVTGASDRAFFRAPEVRGRLVKIYTNNKTRGALNLKLTSLSIRQLGCETGVQAGQKLADVYLSQIPEQKYAWVNGWHDQRWVRMHTLINGLRQYLQGFGYAVDKPFDGYSLIQQIQDATKVAPLASGQKKSGDILTHWQADQLRQAVLAIAELEKTLSHLSLPQPYAPSPQSSLRFKPQT